MLGQMWGKKGKEEEGGQIMNVANGARVWIPLVLGMNEDSMYFVDQENEHPLNMPMQN